MSPFLPRIIMLGTKDFAVPTFLRLLDSGQQVIALVTQPDRPQGRKQELIPSRIKLAAIERGIPVFQPENVNQPVEIRVIAEWKPDYLVTAAYGQILSPELLSVPRKTSINLHGSILPSYRGAAPVARAIQQGETVAGVTVIQMSPRVDAGGMLKFAQTAIGPDETAGELEDRLAILGAPLIVKVIGEFEQGTASILPQAKAKVTKAPKLKKEDGQIDWSLPAKVIHNLIRAMNPWPLATTTWSRPDQPKMEPVRLIVHQSRLVSATEKVPPGVVVPGKPGELLVGTGQGILALSLIQKVGKKPLGAAEFLRGNPIAPGDILGTP